MDVKRRELLAGGLAAALAGGVAGSPANTRAVRAAGTAGAVDPLSLVDPELVNPLITGPQIAVSAANLSVWRKIPDSPPLPPPAPPPVKRTIPGRAGAPDVRLLIIDPGRGASPRAALLFMHGGGYVMGDAGQALTQLQGTAADQGILIVSVDYRLAPETRFPGSLEDNYSALLWLYRNAGSLGVDPKRIAIGGDSAGGGHAAMLAIAARDRGEVPIAFQLLIYPMLDDRTGSTLPRSPNIGQFLWLRASNRFGWTSLLGMPAGSPKVPEGSVPARVRNLAGLPSTFIGVGAIDLFVEEDIEYARRLIDAGVPTELFVVPGAYHGFDLVAPEARASRIFASTWNAALRKALQPSQ
jgi:acetyl esterase/lipase